MEKISCFMPKVYVLYTVLYINFVKIKSSYSVARFWIE